MGNIDGETLVDEVREEEDSLFSELGLEDENDNSLNMMRTLAKKGRQDAILWMGMYYNNGDGGKKDFAEACYWFNKSTDASAKVAMASVYEREGSKELAMKFYEEAVDAEADKEDIKKGMDCMSPTVGNLSEDVHLAEHYKRREETSEETLYEGPVSEESGAKESVADLKVEAETDDLSAIKQGFCYMKGDGVEQNLEEALKWLAKSNSSLAYYTAAIIYMKQEKYPEAEKALVNGLNTEDTTATGHCYLMLGKLDLTGNTSFGEPDYELAARCLEIGLDLEPAQGTEYAGLLGLAYEGAGQLYDAIHWYRAAIDEFGQDIYKEKLYNLYLTGIVGQEKKQEAKEAMQ